MKIDQSSHQKSSRQIRCFCLIGDGIFADRVKSFFYRIPETGELVEVRSTISKILEKESHGFIELPDGNMARRAISEELSREGLATQSGSRLKTHAKWPVVSTAAGVNPDQIGELREHWRRHGITGCDVKPNGDVVYHSRRARKMDHKTRGLYDRDGGYGDAMPDNL